LYRKPLTNHLPGAAAAAKSRELMEWLLLPRPNTLTWRSQALHCARGAAQLGRATYCSLCAIKRQFSLLASQTILV